MLCKFLNIKNEKLPKNEYINYVRLKWLKNREKITII